MPAVVRGSIQSFPGVAAPVGGHERAAPLFCITGTAALFRASGPAAAAPPGDLIQGGVATEPPAGHGPGAVSVRCGRAPAENRPGGNRAASAGAVVSRQSCGRVTNDVGGVRPREGRPLPRQPPRGAPWRRAAGGRPIVPAPGRCGWWGPESRAPPCLKNPHQTAAGGNRNGNSPFFGTDIQAAQPPISPA